MCTFALGKSKVLLPYFCLVLCLLPYEEIPLLILNGKELISKELSLYLNKSEMLKEELKIF